MSSSDRETKSAVFLGVQLNNQYANLDPLLSRKVIPTPVAAPQWILTNDSLANDLNLSTVDLQSDETLAYLAGNQVIPNSTPVAQAYAGHQFGYFNPQLGDGRAILLGELDGPNSTLFDMALKGSGVTPFSRNGDGRSAIGPVIREFIVSEAMHCLGIPTSRCLAAVATGEPVFRNGETPGGVVTRIAQSHLRVGTFEYLQAYGKKRALKTLANHAINRLYPELANDDTPYSSFLTNVAKRQAYLVAHWMRVGFIHGVMNTDNFTVSGETLDYGPCAFLDEFHPHKVFSSIDREGRYSFSNQPNIAIWNLARLGEAISSLIEEETNDVEGVIQKALGQFQNYFQSTWRQCLANKVGLGTLGDEEDIKLVEDLLDLFDQNETDYTLGFRQLLQHTIENPAEPAFESAKLAFEQNDWLERWHGARAKQDMDNQGSSALMLSSNPLYIPRNHQLERVITAAENGDFSPSRALYKALQKPYEYQTEHDDYLLPPTKLERVTQTFCGT